MADLNIGGLVERDIDQAVTALKKGAQLLKYGRRGKPKFCPFRLSNDESTLLWYSGKNEKELKLSNVSRIIPGQRTAIFQRYPRPEKEYQSFSLIYNDRSLDVICKDKDEAEVWFAALKALISRGGVRSWRTKLTSDSVVSQSPRSRNRRSAPSITFDIGDTQRNQTSFEYVPPNGLAKAFSDIVTYTAVGKSLCQTESVASLNSLSSGGVVDSSNGRSSAAETFRVSLSSVVSSSSQGSGREDFDALGDVFIWGEGIGDGTIGSKMDALVPKSLESTVVLDVSNIACGSRHAVLVTKQGEIFSWGEESGGRLGHGVEADVSQPKLIDTLSGMNIERVACGEYHTCAVTFSGDLYTWGDGTHNSGLLGHGSEASHRIPKRVTGRMEGIRITHISCGPWHTAIISSVGQLFTFGDGTFGALGHGDNSSTVIPRQVGTLIGLRTIRVACGIWHTAAIVEVGTDSLTSEPSACSSPGPTGSSPPKKLFTWGDGDKGRLGHGDKESKIIPCCVAALGGESFCQVACGHSLTVGLTTSGKVHAMGSSVTDGLVPVGIVGDIANSVVEEIACGSHHVAVLTSKSRVYTWGKGTYGQLGHGDRNNRKTPTLVNFLKDKQVKSIACGSNFTAAICIHKWASNADRTVCAGCHNPFGFRRKRHNCYNCGLVFCKACSSRKSLKASLAPNLNKSYRVCDDCFNKLKKLMESGCGTRIPKGRSVSISNRTIEMAEKEITGPRLPGQLSRFLSVGSFSRSGSPSSKCDSRVFPASNGNLQWAGFDSSQASNCNVISASVPGSRTVSRSTSPASTKSVPIQPATRTEDLILSSGLVHNSNQTNDFENQELLTLRAKVEELTLKSQKLETQLEKNKKQLKEVTTIAADEAEKCKAAKEVIKSLTAQLKDLAEKVPEIHLGSGRSKKIDEHSLNILNMTSIESPSASLNFRESGANGNLADADHLRSVNSSESESNGNLEYPDNKSRFNSRGSESNGNLANPEDTSNFNYRENESNGNLANTMIPNGTKNENGRSERVIQDEPGVYVTLTVLSGGVNELKRVRFSRKHFTEEQAEKWWTENGAKVCEKHNIRAAVS